MKSKRVFLIVLDSFGIGELPDADKFGDKGSNTLGAIYKSKKFSTPFLKKMGLFNIDGVTCGQKEENTIASYGRMTETSMGKDTTIGHWEISGIISKDPLPTYPNGFPKEVLDEFEKQTGRKVICNKPYSGTDVIRDYGKQHVETGDLIVYTSADSVFQIAAHESVVPIETLYEYCRIARKILKGKHGVGRVIARPFTGEHPYTRTSNRHDFSLLPPAKTMLDSLKENGYDVISVGKIYDIFAGKSIDKSNHTVSNADGMEKTLEIEKNEDFTGLCFINLVDFDMKYGHRNDVDGYANAMTEFDTWLKTFVDNMNKDDMLIITADHGCDPSTPSTDHSREYTPMIIFGDMIKGNHSIGTRPTFADIGATILDAFGIKDDICGNSFLSEVIK